MFPKQSTRSLLRQRLRDLRDTLRRVPFARPRAGQPDSMPVRITERHVFKPSPTLENKKANLREAARRINAVTVLPGEVFSFWHTVGNPNDSKRFREGRSIHAGKPTRDMGGGLCQASGLLHHVALLGHLTVLERYGHSVDLYTDETRFAPLGTDATVFFGYKNLRLRNNLNHPIKFRLTILEDALQAELLTDAPLERDTLRTRLTVEPDGTKDVTILISDSRPLCHTRYFPLP